MWWGIPKLPIADDERLLIEKYIQLLVACFGEDRLLESKVILPEPQFFPDPFKGDEDSVRHLLTRVSGYMGADPKDIDLELGRDGTDSIRQSLPYWQSKETRAAGEYHAPERSTGRHLIVVDARQLKDPTGLIAVLAHEVAHFVLLNELRVPERLRSNERLTDMLTIYSGMGIFNANAAFRFRQYEDGNKAGWTASALGYLSQEEFGYALACWAFLRRDLNHGWSQHLATNVRSYMKTGSKYLTKGGNTSLSPVNKDSPNQAL